MNDRYLYRAKRKDNGEWVIGLPGYDIDGNITEIEVYRGHEDCVTYEVDPSTLCQCIGIRDKNGKLMWENDIARRKIFDREVFGIVKWCDIGYTGFRLEVAKEDGKKNLYSIGRGTYDDDMGERCDDEIIGNIFDNPELLEGETE